MSSKLAKRHKYYNNAFFARWAKLYDYEKYLFSTLRRKTVRFLNLKKQQKILDVATGTGSQALAFATVGHNVTGIDLSPEMLAQAKKKITPELKLSFLQVDATNLPFKDNEFEVSSISLGLHDMPYEIDLMVLKEMKRVTKKNGKILVVDYMEPKNHWVASLAYPIIKLYETHNWRPFIARSLDRILADVGLKIERKTNWLGLVQIVVITNKK